MGVGREGAASHPAAAPAGAALLATDTRYRRDIDGLRAIAVLAVLFFHAFPDRLPGGFVGVDVFFVISGFLITGILLSSLARGRFSLGEFYSRRVRRIFPALAVTMAACWSFGWFALFPDEYRQLGRHIVGGAAFISNFYFWNEAGYFDNAGVTKPLLHLWSLGIEEQFYILWPLLLYVTHRFRVGVLRWMPALAVVSFAVNVGGIGRYPTATFYSPAGRAWELAIGGILACLAARRSPLLDGTSGGRRREAAAASGLALVALAVALLEEGKAFPGWWALLPTAGTALVLAAGPGTWVNRVLLSSRPMVAIGLISYPLYLWHWPLLSFARIVESKTPGLAIRVAAVVAAFVLAALTYWLVERPFRFGGHSGRKVATLAVSMGAVFAAGRITYLEEGLPRRATIQEQMEFQRALELPDDSKNAAACKQRYGFRESWEFCLLDKVDAPPTVALVGDSHAHHVVEGLTEFYRQRGGNLLYLGTRLPFWNVDILKNDNYQDITNRMLDIALEEPGVETVILSTALRFENHSRPGKELEADLEGTLRRFAEAGKHVIWVEDVPELDFDPRECIRRGAIPSSNTRVPCAVPRAIWEKKTAGDRLLLARMQEEFPSLEIFHAPKYLCDEELCWAVIDGKLLYRDKDHLSSDGDLFIGRKFAAERGGREPEP